MNDLAYQSKPTVSSLTVDEIINQAWLWLCKRRRDYPASADGSTIELWSARDSLVLKALSLVLSKHLNVSTRCTHLKGHGGSKAAVRAVANALSEYRFVFRTDVKSFYASIDHLTLYKQLCERIEDKGLRRLLWQYLRRTVEHGGLYQEIEKGISLGCPLSPLIGGLCLQPIDTALQREELFYIRFMDDWVVLAKTRRHLRRAVRLTNQILNELKLEKHPDKTFVGSIEKGFDFLGYHFTPQGLRMAQSSIDNFMVKAARLYEQEPHSGALGLYVRRFTQWCTSGIRGRDKPHLCVRLIMSSVGKWLDDPVSALSCCEPERY